MCGICGYISKREKPDLDAMTNVMIHRGPDDRGIYLKIFDEINIGLGHRRLSIIDLSSAGHQPMANEDETIWIVFNGEIYNFLEIKPVLIDLGHIFKSNSDTEVIIHAYEEWGEKCLEKFNGIFSFAIWDEKKKKLFVARDRLGVKPLYYFCDSDSFVFASEIKSILISKLVEAEVNVEAIPYYLTFLWVPGPQTMFKNIFKLLPGHYLVRQDNKIEIKQYWDIQSIKQLSSSEGEIGQRLLGLLRQTIKKELVSDVPLGSFLGGGIDSSIITTLMTEVQIKPVNTFTINFSPNNKKVEGLPLDVTYSRILKQQLKGKLNYQEIFIQPDFVDLLPKAIWHTEEPIADPAIILTYLICRAAKDNGITVMLSGMGGDEVFAGYNRHIAQKLLYYCDKLRLRFALVGLKKIVNRTPILNNWPFTAALRYLKKIAKHFDLPPDQRYVGISSWLSKKECLNLLSDKIKRQIHQQNWQDIHLEFYNKHNFDYLDRALYTDLKTFLVDLNLTYTDKMSMAASVEARVPLINPALVEFAFQIPSKLKLRHWTTKGILKKIFQNILPKKIIKRGKVGFGAPIRSWFNDLQSVIQKNLSPEMLKKQGYFDPKAVQLFLQKNAQGREDYNYQIWALLTFSLWHQIFIDKTMTIQPDKTNIVKT